MAMAMGQYQNHSFNPSVHLKIAMLEYGTGFDHPNYAILR
jgi:hypothetical protein